MDILRDFNGLTREERQGQPRSANSSVYDVMMRNNRSQTEPKGIDARNLRIYLCLSI